MLIVPEPGPWMLYNCLFRPPLGSDRYRPVRIGDRNIPKRHPLGGPEILDGCAVFENDLNPDIRVDRRVRRIRQAEGAGFHGGGTGDRVITTGDPEDSIA